MFIIIIIIIIIIMDYWHRYMNEKIDIYSHT